MSLNIDAAVLAQNRTPFYYYDMDLLKSTINEIKTCIADKPVKVHYAIKANGEARILKTICNAGFGADCVSGGEIKAAVNAGFAPGSIFYAGVGKTDDEIRLGLELGIGCFNVESIEELQVISEIAEQMHKVAPVALRVNPNIDAHTHHYITTGLEENKFGIDMTAVPAAIDFIKSNTSIKLRGLHFHIGSQITINEPFELLCRRINALTADLYKQGVELEFINVGGGIGVDYDEPDANPISDFRGFFSTILKGLNLLPGQEIHCEPGRSLVAQCGSLISKVLYVKKGIGRKFAIIDAGMTDLIRPALYQARHRIDKLGNNNCPMERYDVVGPVCESSDVFGINEELPELQRGDYVALRTAGAYGSSMASTYNMRQVPRAVFSE